MSKLVRLYPRHVPLGFVLRSYTILDPPLRFMVHRGWYEVDDAVADMLKDIPQQERYPTGPRAFMIAADKAEAKKLDAKAAEVIAKAVKVEQVGTADEPVKATTAARPGSRSTVAVPDEDAKEGAPKARTRKKKK